jgi:hypothetical protein
VAGFALAAEIAEQSCVGRFSVDRHVAELPLVGVQVDPPVEVVVAEGDTHTRVRASVDHRDATRFGLLGELPGAVVDHQVRLSSGERGEEHVLVCVVIDVGETHTVGAEGQSLESAALRRLSELRLTRFALVQVEQRMVVDPCENDVLSAITVDVDRGCTRRRAFGVALTHDFVRHVGRTDLRKGRGDRGRIEETLRVVLARTL